MVLQVDIVDDHNEALDALYRLIARNKLPFTGMTLLHFDSHPDLAVPETIPTEKFSNRRELLAEITISDWILPAIYRGHFTEVIWVKPHWSCQVEDGTYNVEIGREPSSGLLKTTSTLPYYLSDSSYSCSITDTKTFTLTVLTFMPSSLNTSFIQLQNQLRDKPFCLDVDMDFFSTQNPFKDLLGKYFNPIHELFKFRENLNSPKECLEYRSLQLECLRYFCEQKAIPSSQSHLINSEFYQTHCRESISDIIEVLEGAKRSIEDDEHVSDIFVIGQQTELPHHISSEQEIAEMMGMLKEALKGLKVSPLTITLARSVYDEYSPPESMNFIQESLLNLLRTVYPDITDKKCNFLYGK